MKACRTAAVLVLLLALAIPASASATSLVVVIGRPDGSCHLNLSAEMDGPIRLPVEAKQLKAVELATAVIGESVIVTVSGVRDELAIDPIGQYELALGAKPTDLYELGAYGVDGWSLSLTLQSGADAQGCPGGCGCGGICCYPNPGKCISCGTCGDCCASPSDE